MTKLCPSNIWRWTSRHLKRSSRMLTPRREQSWALGRIRTQVQKRQAFSKWQGLKRNKRGPARIKHNWTCKMRKRNQETRSTWLTLMKDTKCLTVQDETLKTFRPQPTNSGTAIFQMRASEWWMRKILRTHWLQRRKKASNGQADRRTWDFALLALQIRRKHFRKSEAAAQTRSTSINLRAIISCSQTQMSTKNPTTAALASSGR